MRSINCKNCGVLVEDANNTQMFCNVDCRESFKGEKRKLDYPEKRGHSNAYKQCGACKTMYQGANRKYCSDGCVEDATRHGKWGIPLSELREFRLNNEKVCAICGTTKQIVLDHCHDTNEIRGWLCRMHNAAIGQLGDDLEGVMRAVDYFNNIRK